MSNLLKVAMIDLILSLHRKGWSQRRIAAELEINRETVARYLKQARAAPKPAIAPPGSDSRRASAKTSQCAPRLESAWRSAANRRCPAAAARPVTAAAEPAVAPATASRGET